MSEYKIRKASRTSEICGGWDTYTRDVYVVYTKYEDGRELYREYFESLESAQKACRKFAKEDNIKELEELKEATIKLNQNTEKLDKQLLITREMRAHGFETKSQLVEHLMQVQKTTDLIFLALKDNKDEE